MTDNQNPKPDESTWFSENSGITGQSQLFDIDRERERAASSPVQERLIESESTIDREDIIGEEGKIAAFKNPYIKSALVVGVIGTLIGGSTMLYLQSSNTPAPIAEKKPPAEEFKDATVADSQIKGELALSKQNDQLKLDKVNPQPVKATVPITTGNLPTATPVAIKPARQPIATPAPARVTPTPTPAPVYRSRPTFDPPRSYTPTRSYTPPRPVAISSTSRSFAPTSRIAYNPPKSQPFAPPRQVYKPPSFPSTLNQPFIPAQPQAVNPSSPPSPPMPQTLVSWKEQSTDSTFGRRFQQTANDNPKTVAVVPKSYLASENEILGTPGEPVKVLQVGAKALGLLLTPVQLSASEEMGQTISIGLNQPLIDRSGKIVVPAGSQIQFKITAMNNGWIKATSQKIYIDGQSFDAVDSFTIVTQDGQPLIAESKQFGSDIVAQQDRRSFIFSALQKVGSVLTAPDTQSTVNATVGGIATSNTTTPNRDILGAVLQGGFDPLAAAQLNRSTTEINRLLSASKLWFLPIGTNVQIITTQQSRF